MQACFGYKSPIGNVVSGRVANTCQQTPSTKAENSIANGLVPVKGKSGISGWGGWWTMDCFRCKNILIEIDLIVGVNWIHLNLKDSYKLEARVVIFVYTENLPAPAWTWAIVPSRLNWWTIFIMLKFQWQWCSEEFLQSRARSWRVDLSTPLWKGKRCCAQRKRS